MEEAQRRPGRRQVLRPRRRGILCARFRQHHCPRRGISRRRQAPRRRGSDASGRIRSSSPCGRHGGAPPRAPAGIRPDGCGRRRAEFAVWCQAVTRRSCGSRSSGVAALTAARHGSAYGKSGRYARARAAGRTRVPRPGAARSPVQLCGADRPLISALTSKPQRRSCFPRLGNVGSKGSEAGRHLQSAKPPHGLQNRGDCGSGLLTRCKSSDFFQTCERQDEKIAPAVANQGSARISP